MSSYRKHTRSLLLGATALVGSLALTATPASAQQRQYDFDLPPQPLEAAVQAFARQAQQQVIFSDTDMRGMTAPRLSGSYSADEGLAILLAGTGLEVRRTASGVLKIAADQGPQGGSAGAAVEALIVTAQKREEDIQDVPIAISAFSQEDLTRSQVAGGPDLMTQVPNMTFTKTNFSSYSIQIRGIGTQAISATTDPGVAVAFNNTPFIRNRFFEQEFYDLQRVEVLRGPQGTLYGRNATAGVVNIISAKPSFRYEAKLSGDVANYKSTRLEGMVNIPLVEDAAALRLAGAWTKRDGFVTNQITGNPIDGRDLWSTRVSLRVSPNDRIDANLIWEHFEENDDRLRSGKQTCKTHEVSEFRAVFPDGTVQVFQTGHYDKLYDNGQGGGALFSGVQATFSKGCEESSLYSPDSFQTPNGLSVPYYIAIQAIGLPAFPVDPYVSRFQSQDLRVIESTIDPKYRAKSDLAELQLSFDITPSLTLSSETAYSTDFVFSSQDFNRFNTAPGAFRDSVERPGILNDGVFCDPQIGCADRLVAMDLSTAKSRHFSQEFRLASDFDGPANFSLGANFLRYDTEDKYYVFINSLSLLAAMATLEGLTYGSEEFRAYVAGETDNRVCLNDGPIPPNPALIQGVQGCVYIDPNSIENLNDQGHNYFLSRNPYKLISYAMFGEAYYQVTDNLKITAGLRWTIDKKEAPTLPSWLLATQSVGYPVTGVVRQEWREPTGRLTIDWKPDLNFTDETLLYASFAHGYKAGGANPPPAGPSTYSAGGALAEAIVHKSSTHPQTFEPEFVNAIEVGAKNTLLDGKLTVNAAAFYYDYTGYQISQIIDRSAINFNFDSRIWGLEIEADWRPLENLRLGFKGGYENTRVADGEKAIDIMDRTAGHEGWVVVRPFPTMTANCILPAWLFVGGQNAPTPLINLGAPSGGNPGGCELAYLLGVDPVTRQPYVPNPGNVGEAAMHPNYPGWDPSTAPNNGEGFDKELGGNELPNAPNFTATLTADYTVPLPNEWLMTLHTDLYYQSEAWTRIFNTEGYDKLKAYTNINLAAIFTNEAQGWNVMAYVKNVMDRDSITGAFLFSDDTGLTTNVFLTEPRLYGLRVTKEFTGGSWWTGANPDRPVGEPYPFTIELGGSVLRTDAPYDPVSPVFEDNLSPALQPSVTTIQNRDLDWGDGREIKLTYARNGWRVSAGMRTGDANGGSHKSLATELGDYGCRLAAPCDPYITSVGHPHGFNYVDGDVRDTEKHTIIDFVVGREVGIGAFGMKSTLSAGLRHAELESTTRFIGFAVPDWDIPDAFAYVYNGPHSTHHRYETDVTAHREFEGYGPVLSWDAARRLLGDGASGHLDLDWSLEGGVLFGKQRTFGSGQEDTQFFSGSFYYDYATTLLQGPIVVTPPATPTRSRSATVPTFAATLGLSYEIQRLKVSTGYRWERYFDALDVGWATPKDADRTIDGPYFKLSIGFGG